MVRQLPFMPYIGVMSSDPVDVDEVELVVLLEEAMQPAISLTWAIVLKARPAVARESLRARPSLPVSEAQRAMGGASLHPIKGRSLPVLRPRTPPH